MLIGRTLVSLSLALCAACAQGAAPAGQQSAAIPAPAVDNAITDGPVQTAVVAGGCFWGVEGVFEHLNGVRQVIAGYAGGEADAARYELVSSGETGHAESVQITFDPSQVSYGQILQVFFTVAHDPTELDRQGPDVGPQYRSAIFYADETQRRIAEAYIAQLEKSGAFPAPIVTRLEALDRFYTAEGYHQDFLVKHPAHPYIVINDLPKITRFRKTLPALYR